MRHHLEVSAEQENCRMTQQDKQEIVDTQKKEYTTPQLVSYGKVFELTKNVTDMGVNDNPTMKT